MLAATVRDSDIETERMGAAYRLALCDSALAVEELAKLFVVSGKPTPCRTAQHSQDEEALRACHYGLGACRHGLAAPRLLELLRLELHERDPSSVTLSMASPAEVCAAGARYNRIKRLSHALGLCLSQPAPTLCSDTSTLLIAAADTLSQARAHVHDALTTYAQHVYGSGITHVGVLSPQRTVANGSVAVGSDGEVAEWVQSEPDDAVGAELRSTHATCIQALGLVAEVAVATSNAPVCVSVLDELTCVLSDPEPGENLTVRMGSSAREQAGIGLLSLAGGLVDPHARMVAPNEPSGGAFAVKMTEGWVCGYVAEAIARLRRAATRGGSRGDESNMTITMLERLEQLGAKSHFWGGAVAGEDVPFCLFDGTTGA